MSDLPPDGNRATNLPARLGWTFIAIAAAVLVGIVAASLQAAGFAPVVVRPLLAGCLLGWLLARFLPLTQAGRPACWAAALALVAVTAEHLWLYKDYRQQWQQVRIDEPAVVLFRPDDRPKSLVEFFRDHATPINLLHWAADATLLLVATVVIVRWSRRQGPSGDRLSEAPLPPDKL